MMKPVELFYVKGNSTKNEKYKSVTIDQDGVSSDDRTVDLLNEKGEIDELSLKMIFY